MFPQELRHLPLFAAFTDDQLDQLGKQGEHVQLSAGEVLFEEGDPAQGLYVILAGELEILKRVGGQTVTLANVPVGSFVGEISLLTGMPHNATARANAPTHLLKFGAFVFEGVKESPIAQLILATMVQRLSNTEAQVQQHQKLSALGKMAAGLAHELNNPASANLRAATQLPSTLATLQAQTLKLYSANLSAEQLDFLSDLQGALIERAASADALSPLALSDCEDRLNSWLDEAEIEEGWRLAPMLASAGMTTAELEVLAEQVGVNLLGLILNWLESALTIAGLSHTLRQSASRVSELIKAVKAYTYMDQTPLQEIDLHEGLDNTLTVLGNRLHHIIIERNYDRSLPRLTAYGSELNQVWTILFENAVDALEGQGNIWVRTVHENEYALAEIVDDGPGIPAELHARVFEPFFTTKRVGQGTGLNLSIARRIVVDRHHGMIRFESQPGKTCFQVYLPLEQAL
jgi:signal transduction histidine kinase